MVKNLLAMQETHVRSLGGEDPLEKEMAPHSSILKKKKNFHSSSISTWELQSLLMWYLLTSSYINQIYFTIYIPLPFAFLWAGVN